VIEAELRPQFTCSVICPFVTACVARCPRARLRLAIRFRRRDHANEAHRGRAIAVGVSSTRTRHHSGLNGNSIIRDHIGQDADPRATGRFVARQVRSRRTGNRWRRPCRRGGMTQPPAIRALDGGNPTAWGSCRRTGMTRRQPDRRASARASRRVEKRDGEAEPNGQRRVRMITASCHPGVGRSPTQ
jgi:hypothetical protein